MGISPPWLEGHPPTFVLFPLSLWTKYEFWYIEIGPMKNVFRSTML